MDIPLRDKVDLLNRLFLFQDLPSEVVAWIAAQFHEVECDRDQEVFAQGAIGDSFYIVYSGNVRLLRFYRGQMQALNILNKGEFFGEHALLNDRPRWATVRTIEKTILLRMQRSRFNTMLKAYPIIRERMEATADSRSLARSMKFDWLNVNEMIQYICRKSDVFLIVGLIIPIFTGILSMPVLSFALTQVISPTFFVLSLSAGLILLFGSIIWGIWSYLDWGNDFYIVTDQRVVWLEKVIALYESRREAPLDTILAVNVTSSQMGRWLGYGNVSVRTFTGGILMRNMKAPKRFASFVEGFKQRSLLLSKEEEARAIETALEQALARSQAPGPQPLPAPPDEPPLIPKTVETPKQQTSFRDFLRNFLKVRYEQGKVITYRKHWFVLLQKAWKPLLGLILMVVVFFSTIQFFFNMNLGTFTYFLLYSAWVVGFLALFTWLTYHYLDWSNDIYRLTTDQILDIERKPLGQEVKKTAPLESILSIEHERENILGILLNFGTVVVNVGQTRFTFIGVYNPDQVHADIADYREALNRRKKAAEAAREREQMISWLVSFHNQTEKMNGESEREEFSR